MTERKTQTPKRLRTALSCLTLLLGTSSLSAYQGTLPGFGINIDNVVYYDTQLPFYDIAHNGGSWIRFNPSQGIWHNTDHPLTLDDNEYPTELNNGWQVRTWASSDAEELPSGNYRLSWDGTGTVTVPAMNVVSSSSNEIIYNLPSSATGQVNIEISSTSSSDHVHNIKLEMPGYASATSRFNPDFVSELSNFGLLRFLDWSRINNNTTLADWSDRNTPDDIFWGNERGVPYEFMVELCNETDSDLWITIPHLADDDYVEKLAQLFRYGSDGETPYTSTVSNPEYPPLESGLRVWIEYSNEVWSPGGPGPAQHNYARDVLQPQYGVSTIAEAYARRASEMWDIFETEWGSDDRLVKVIGGRAGDGSGGWNQEVFLEVSGEADVIGIAPYIGGEVASGSNIPQYIVDNDYDVPYSELYTALSDNIENGMRSNVRGAYYTAALNDAKLVTYEGGPGVVGTGSLTYDPDLTDFLTDFHRDAGWETVYEEYLTMLNEEHLTTYTAYEYVRASGQYGYFGHKEYQDQPLGDSSTPGSAHKLRTLLEWIANPPAPPAPNPVETLIVDDSDSGFYNYGFWANQTWSSGYYGSGWAFRGASDSATQYVEWLPLLIDREGVYEIEVHRFGTGSENQPFTVEYNGGVTTMAVDTSGAEGWVSLGTYDLEFGSRVITYNGFEPTGGSNAIADAVRFTPQFSSSAPTITTSSLPDGTVGNSYSTTLAASGGDGSLSWSIVSGSLPSGLSLNSSTGQISGTPTSAQSSSLTVEVEDADNDTDTAALNLTVNPSAIIIDDDDARFVNNSLWTNQTWGSGYVGSSWHGRGASASNTNGATWLVDFSGTYTIQVRIAGGNQCSNQPFQVVHTGGTTSWMPTDLTGTSGDWVSIGTYTLDTNSSVETTDGFAPADGTWAIADALRFVPQP